MTYSSDDDGNLAHLRNIALVALNRAASCGLTVAESTQLIDLAHKAMTTATALRKTLQCRSSAPDPGELAVFDKASSHLAKLLRLGDRVRFAELDESLRLAGGLRDIVVAILEATDPNCADFETMVDDTARIGNMAMRVSTRMTSETSDHCEEMSCRTEADLGLSALFIALSLFSAVDEAWRIWRNRAATRKPS